jgi:hypothetical protein
MYEKLDFCSDMYVKKMKNKLKKKGGNGKNGRRK